MSGPTGGEHQATGQQRFRRHASGFAWTGFDQVLSAVSNLVISLALARGGGAQALGTFTVAFAIYLMVFSLLRALVSEPLLTVPFTQHKGPDAAECKGATIAALYLVPASLIVLSTGMLLGRVEIVVVGLVLPFVAMQDFFRYVFFRRGRPDLATVLDGAWVATSLVGWPLVVAQGQPSVALVVWALGGAIGVILGVLMSKVRLAPVRLSRAWWWRDIRPLGGFLALDSVLFAFFSQITTIGLAAILGTADLGTLRGAQIVVGPVGLALTAFGVFALPRISASPARQNAQVTVLASAGAALLAAAGSVLLWLLAPVLLPLLYGENLDVPRVLVLAVGTRVTIVALSTGPGLMLRARRRGAPIAYARIAAAVVGVPVVLVTAAHFGLVPAAWAGSIGSLVYLTVLTVAWSRTARGHEART